MDFNSHPRLYHTPEDVTRARLNVKRFDWAKECFKGIRKEADKWAERSDNELRSLVPPPGSIFAYGFSGCPECGADWPWWGSGGVASLDNPGKATCPSCKKSFPDEKHPDDGKGWKSSEDGKTYYLIGCYNSHAAEQITLHALQHLSTAHTVTEDRKYSHAAAVLFDALADLYPTNTEGAVDYPSDENTGRLERPQYQVGRVIPVLSRHLDLMYDSPDFAAPSRNYNGSIREHVEESIIRDGGKYCYDMAVTGIYKLTNGQADYIRGALAAGIMLGEKQWVDAALTGPHSMYNFLDNCLDGDGQYYETSIGYGDHALHVYTDIAEMLFNYRTHEHPDGVNLYKHPKFKKALFDAHIDIDCFGHFPRFGDWAPDTSVVKTDKHFSGLPYFNTEILYARAEDEKEKELWAAARHYICDRDIETRRFDNEQESLQYWLLFHAEPLSNAKISDNDIQAKPVLGGRGACNLRSGKGAKGTAAFLRYGPSVNHGHFDDLNLNFFALGRELTYDLGYMLGSAHVQTGWSKLTASHNLVVVNEKNQMIESGGGGSAHLFVDSAPVKAFEASSEASYASEGVKTYRRTLALVDISPERSYLVDIFRVDGGGQHDQMWNFTGSLRNIEGADMGPVQDGGSLAGPEYEWGTKVGAAGDLVGCSDQRPYWNPPPGNGYGFLCGVRRSTRMSEKLTASWEIDPEKDESLILHILHEPGSELITATGPGIVPELPKADFTVLRRRGKSLKSDFISILEPATGTPAVLSVERLVSESAVGVRVETIDSIDYILSAMDPERVVFQTKDGDISFTGRFGFIRMKDGNVEHAVLCGGTELALGTFKVSSPADAFRGIVEKVDFEHSEIVVDGDVPNNLEGQTVYINRPGYSHNSPYRIDRITENGGLILDSSIIIGRGYIGDGKIDAEDAIANIVPLPKASVVSWNNSGYFQGKLIRNDRTGKTSIIIDIERDQQTVHVNDTSLFNPGDAYTIYDVQPGDEVYVPMVGSNQSPVTSHQ